MNLIERSLSVLFLLGLPVIALSQVNDCTRSQVSQLMKRYPEIRLSSMSQKCWDGKMKDCDAVVLDELASYRKKDESLWAVSRCARTSVEELTKVYPKFHLSTDSQSCLDGKLKAEMCETAILDEVETFRGDQELARRKQELERDKQELAINAECGVNLDMVFGLSQLALLVFFDQTPNTKADFIVKVRQNSRTPSTVKSLIESYLKRKQSGARFTYKDDGKPLMALAQTHLERATDLKDRLTDSSVFHEQMTQILIQANSTFTMVRARLDTLK